jgi:hypothetical protein
VQGAAQGLRALCIYAVAHQDDIVAQRAATLDHVASQISHAIDTCAETLQPHAELLSTALDEVRTMTATLSP